MLQFTKRTLAFLALIAFASVSLYYHNGPGTNGYAVTGAPFNSNTYCNSCHGGGNYAPTISVKLYNGSTQVSTYTAGASYTLHIDMSGTNSPAGYGFQVTCATVPGNTNYNNWGTLPSNTHNVSISSRNYIEQTSTLSSGSLTIPWTAPSAGTGPVKFYLAGNLVNGNSGTSGDVSDTASVTIAESCNTPALSTSVTNLLCNGASTGSVTLTLSGGSSPFTYQWTGPGSYANTTQNISGLAAGTYKVVVTATGGCKDSTTVNVTQPNAIVSSIASQTNVNCNGGNNGAASISASGGTGTLTYSWAPSGGTSSTASGLTAGTYTCTITDANNCTHTQSVTITQPTAITSSVASQTNVTCFNGSNGAASLSVSGGVSPYTYSWSPFASPTANPSSLSAGTYTCTITDANNCTHTQAVNITQPAQIALSITNQSNVGCNGGSNGSATIGVSGGTSPYTYSWSPAGGTAATASNLSAGTYTCTVTDANNCQQTINVFITQPVVLSASTSSTNTNCGANTGSATVTVSGGTSPYTYSWSPVGGTSATASNLGAGSYTCTITDAHFCTLQKSFNIVSNSSLTATTTHSNVSCFGGNNGTASVTVSGGSTPYNYSWSPLGGTNASATTLTAGNYTCTITDNNSCVFLVYDTITQPTAITASVTSQSNVLCNGGNTGSINISASGGTGSLNYNWQPQGGSTTSATNLTAGSYSCIITDAYNCTDTLHATITQPPAISLNTVSLNNVNCNGNNNGSISISATGGTAPLTFSWSPLVGTTATASNLAPGIYTCTVTDANNCNNNISGTITQPPALQLMDSSNAPICYGSTLHLYAIGSGGTGALHYSWSGPSSFTSGLANPSIATATYANAGNYTATVTDSNNCTLTGHLTVLIDSIPSADSIHAVFISADSLNISASNPHAVSNYTWTFGDGNGTSATSNAIIGHHYSANGTDTIKLVVQNACGNDTLTKVVVINNVLVNNLPHLNTLVKLSPNPAHNNIHINAQSTEINKVMINDVFGKVLITEVFNNAANCNINISNLPSGSYMVQTITTNGSIVKMLEVIK